MNKLNAKVESLTVVRSYYNKSIYYNTCTYSTVRKTQGRQMQNKSSLETQNSLFSMSFDTCKKKFSYLVLQCLLPAVSTPSPASRG